MRDLRRRFRQLVLMAVLLVLVLVVLVLTMCIIWGR
jgi:hypothetical protein